MPLVIVSFVPFPAGMQFRSGHPAVASFGVDQGIRGHPFAQTVQFLPLFLCAGLVFEAQQVPGRRLQQQVNLFTGKGNLEFGMAMLVSGRVVLCHGRCRNGCQAKGEDQSGGSGQGQALSHRGNLRCFDML